MKFGEAYREYRQQEREQDRSLAKSSHVEYKRLMKVLKACGHSAGLGSLVGEKQQHDHGSSSHHHPSHNSSQSCPLCDGLFFAELEKQAYEISSSSFVSGEKISRRVRIHDRVLEYVDVLGKTAMFNPYALACGHVFCKTCLCSSASVMLFQGVHAASHKSKCPICRENGVYTNANRMSELNLLVKKRCEKYWKERLRMERAKKAKQSKEFWDQQTKYFVYGL